MPKLSLRTLLLLFFGFGIALAFVCQVIFPIQEIALGIKCTNNIRQVYPNPQLKEAIETVSPEKKKAETCPLNLDGNDQDFLQQVIEFYHQRLLNDYLCTT